jgi:hypothetical protein
VVVGPLSILIIAGLSCFVARAAEAEGSKTNEIAPVKLGRSIEAAFHKGDFTVFDREFDVDAMLGRAFKNLAVSEKYRRDFSAGFKSSWRRQGLRAALEKASDYKFLRHRKLGTNTSLVFRLIGQDAGLNYHEHVLGPGLSGKPPIIDTSILLAGELLSETIRRIALMGVDQRGLIDRLLQREADFLSHSKDIQRLMQHWQRQEYRQLLALYRQLPESLQNEKFLLLYKLQAGAQVDEAEYMRTISQWEKLFPRDPSLYLVSLDGHVLRKDYGAAIKSIESLNSYVGGDAYLLLLTAGQSKLSGDNETAHTRATEAIQAEPALTQAYDFLVGLLLEEKRFADIPQLLLDWENIATIDVAQLVKDRGAFESFRVSPEYRKYLAARARRAGSGSRPKEKAAVATPSSKQ